MDTKRTPVVQKVADVLGDFGHGKKHMTQQQKSDLRKQMEAAIDEKLDEKVVPRFDQIDSELGTIKGALTQLTNTVNKLVPKQP
jgi:hypothetical protein